MVLVSVLQLSITITITQLVNAEREIINVSLSIRRLFVSILTTVDWPRVIVTRVGCSLQRFVNWRSSGKYCSLRLFNFRDRVYNSISHETRRDDTKIKILTCATIIFRFAN